LAAGNFRNALAAPRIFHNHYGNLLGVDRGGCAVRRFDDVVQYLVGNWIGLITAIAVMGLEEAYCIVHEFSCTDFGICALPLV